MKAPDGRLPAKELRSCCSLVNSKSGLPPIQVHARKTVTARSRSRFLLVRNDVAEVFNDGVSA